MLRRKSYVACSHSSLSEETIAEDSLWGEYDEAAAAQSFLQAVKAWRGEDDTDKNAG